MRHNPYYSPIVFAEITAAVYIIIAVCYLQIDITLAITSTTLCILSLCMQMWLYNIRAIIVCIITGYAGLSLIFHLYILQLMSLKLLYLTITLYILFYIVYCISAYDACMDTYLFEQLVGKLFCWPKYSCYQLSVKLGNGSCCHSNQLGLLWHDRYCYAQLDDTCKDIMLYENGVNIYASVVDKVYKYW